MGRLACCITHATLIDHQLIIGFLYTVLLIAIALFIAFAQARGVTAARSLHSGIRDILRFVVTLDFHALLAEGTFKRIIQRGGGHRYAQQRRYSAQERE